MRGLKYFGAVQFSPPPAAAGAPSQRGPRDSKNAPGRSVRGVLPVMLVEEVLVEGDTEVVGNGAQVIVGDGLADQPPPMDRTLT